ncbi:protein TASOR 2 isoform X1 [Caretta caretta]|uniref:protein TASOR 2 isoform X1 n=1 Tax=Caretta caretta TaxID=8467 RepID=UPI003D4E38C4
MGEPQDAGAAAAAFHQMPVDSSSLYQSAVSVLHNSYLDSTSRNGFQYSRVTLVNNDVFLKEYKTFTQEKEASGYTKEELDETYAFLLFDSESEAKAVCQSGLRINTRSLTTLGDPAKGAYVSKYSDYLHPRPWYHGKSGCIVIFKLIKGKVKFVPENYTANYTNPTPGYDCHASVNINNISLETSHFRAFELSQYYVYEFSSDTVVERPRQICPYVIIAFQYTEPKIMSTLNHKRIIELENKVYYCPWRGQLSIQGHLLCDIALRSPYSAVIPAQLPAKLEMKYIIGVSDLKKKLPEAAFGKSNYTENEVCYQDIYFSLYEVEISNKDQHKMDPLLENLKEKELAIIKYLQDQGFLILLTSSALTGDKGFDLDEPISLQALFLFTSSRSVCLTVKKQELNCENKLNEISLKVTSVLPGLHYAIQEATACPPEAGLHSSILVKRYFQKFAKLAKNSLAASGTNDNLPLSCDPSPNKSESVCPSEKCPKQSFSQLQSYLSDPGSYSLEMSVALDCLAGNPQSLCGISDRTCEADLAFVLPPDSVLPDIAAEIRVETEKPKNIPELNQFQEDTKVEMNPAGNLKMQQNKRKSNRAIVSSTKKKWAPLKILSVVDSNRKGTKKKRMNVSFPFPKKQGLTTNSNEPTLKLANLQFPHKRKRGAEVLSAEFVHRTQSSPEDTSLAAKKPRKLKQPDAKNDQISEQVAKQTKSKTIKTIPKGSCKPKAIQKLEPVKKETLSLSSNEVPSESQGTVSGVNETYTHSVTAQDVNLTLKGSNCESHGLNLLADLALSSCIPPLDHKDSRAASPYDLSKERRSLRKRKPSRIASDHEYHRVDKHLKGGSSSSQTENQKLSSPAKSDLRKDLAAIPRDKSPVISSKKNCTSPNSAKARPLLSKEALDTSDVNKHSSIASEHSYASQISEHSKKNALPKGAQGPAAFRNGAKSAKSGPLVGKVLPFRHQQNNTHAQKPFDDLVVKRRRGALSSRLKEDFSKSHTVKSCDGSVKVTCQWEAEYLFNLDSKYTNNSLEKTVIRALHGPWDPGMPDDVEEMKLILHMWVALFYSKPNKFLSSTRKVVEHSNPEKYVSINSSLDAFELSDDCEGAFNLEKCPADSQSEANQTSSTTLELSDDCEGAFGLEKCPADSQSEVNQVSSTVHSTVSYSSEQLLSCDEPSSTSCIKTFSNNDCSDPSSPPLKDGPQEVIIDGCVDIVHAFNKVDEEKNEREELLDPVISISNSTCSPSGKPSNIRIRPEEFSTDDSDEAHQALDLSKVSQSDSVFSQTEFPEKQENKQPAIISDDTVISEERQTLDNITLSAEDNDNCQAGGDGSLRLCEAIELEVNMKSTKHDSPCGKGRESYDLLENQGEEEEEEDFDYESINAEPIDLALSESNDADLEHEDMDQDPINVVLPKEICIPEESKAISPVDLEEPFDSVLTLTLSPGASPVQDVPSDEITQSEDALPENQEVTVKPAEEINDADMDQDPINVVLPKEICIPEESKAISPVDLEEPFDSVLTLTLSPGASPVQDVPSDEITQSEDALPENQEVTVKPAEEINDADMDQDPINVVLPKEICIPEESKAISPVDLEEPFDSVLTLTLSPGASPVQDIPSDEITQSEDALPENQEVTVKPAEEINDADMEHEDMDQDPINVVLPKEICIPEESKAISPVDLEEPFDSVLTLTLSPGASPVQDIPSDEITQSEDALPENQEVTVKPAEEINDADMEHEDMDQDPINVVLPKEICIPEESKAISPVDLEEPFDSVLTLTLSPGASPVQDVPSDEITQSEDALPENQEVTVKPAEEINDADMEHEDMDQDPINVVLPKEICIPEESKAISPVDLEEPFDSVLTLTLSPGASLVQDVPSDEITQSADALPENQEITVQPAEEIKSSAQSDSVEDSCISQEDSGTGSADYTSLSIKESNQVQSNTATQGEQKSPSTDTTELLNKSSEASESPCLVFENIHLEADSEAKKSCDKFKNTEVCSVTKKSPCNDELNQVTMVITHGEHETSLCKLVESACILSVDNEKSFAKEHLDLKQINFVNHQYTHSLILSEEETSPTDKSTRTDPELMIGTPFQQHSSPISRDTELHKSILEPSEHDPVLCKNMNSDHTDQIDVTKICSISESLTPLSAGDDSSSSCYTERPKKDKFLEHETPVVKIADLLRSEEEISPADKPTCTNPELLTGVAFQQHSIPISRETDVHTNLLKQSEKNPVFSKSMNSDHTDQIDVMEMSSTAEEAFSGSCYTEWAKKDMFLDHKIPVGKVADLLENDDKEEPTSHEEFDLRRTSRAASTPSILEEEEEQFAEACDQSSVCEITELQSDCMMEESNMFADLHQTNLDDTREEIPVSSVQMPTTLYAHTDSRETLEVSDTEDILEKHLANQGTKFPNKGRGVHLTFESLSYESFSGDSDQEYFGGTVHPTAKFRGSCGTRPIDTIRATSVTRTNYDCSCLSSANENWKSDDWDSLEAGKRFSVVESGWPVGFREDARYVPPFVNIKDDQGTVRDYTNFIVTKKHKDKTRPLQPSKRHDHFVERSDLISSLTRTWKVIDDLTQNTLDMECLRFSYKLKQVIKSQKSRLSTSNCIFPKEISAQVMAETLPLREAPEAPSLNSPCRSRSPLLVTVVRSDTRQRSSSWHPRNDIYTDFAEPPLFVPWQDKFSSERNAAKVKSQGRDYGIPLHLSKLKYDDKLKESRGDISVILNEYAEFNRVILNNIHVGNKGRGQSTTSEECAGKRKKCTHFPKRTASYENMISDLCNTLHYRLKSVVKEACKNACMFYLVETEDDPFFVRMKSLLKKGGHAEIEPLNFCKAQHLETDRLIVIIRNEDISLHIHKIPSLLRLKHCPNVTFAGVDSPEDVTDHTYQELFHMGGFVVSDDEVLETVTLGQLKEIVKTLEKLNSHGKWKWLLHYKESKKLKEDIRVDSTAHKKNWILKSCQEANTVEVLHYHQCDSKSCTKSEHLKCLLNLQVQHISARFAVYLTDKPSVSREVFESKGILVTDVNNFTGTVQNVVVPFQSSYW